MKRSISKLYFLPLLILVLVFSSLPALAELPELIPMDVFFSGGTKGGAKVSPDGKYISYMSPVKGVMNVWLKTQGKNDDRIVTTAKGSGVPSYHWAMDSKHIIYMKDNQGDENFHVYATNIDTGKTRDLVAFKGVKAQNILFSKKHPDQLLVGLNVRDKRHHDMYRINLKTGKTVLDTQNPGDVRWWLADHDFVVRAAVALNPKDISTILRVRDGADKPWRDLMTWPFGETGLLEGYGSQIAVSFTKDGKALFVQSAFEGDQTSLAKVDIKTGKVIKIVASDPKASIWNIMDLTLYEFAQVILHPKTGEVQAVGFSHLKPFWKILDKELEKDFENLSKAHGSEFHITSRDSNNQVWTVKYDSDHTTGAYYVYDRKTKKVEFLFESAPQLAKYKFSPVKPMMIKARDGLEIPCYLTLPLDLPAKNLPLVAFVHGGPWSRDEWGFNGITQFLVNRGYAIVSINFRGSSGFGKNFMNAGNGQWGVGSMQHDISDVVKQLIKEGIADPKRVAITGGSYGGYAVLAGLAFTPDLFTCGIDICGPSNVRTTINSMPDWWYLIKQRWLRRIGAVLTDDAFNKRISPYYHADKIKSKLLIFHGKNDPRVKIEESNQIVETMRKNKKDVTYVVYTDEGHGPSRGPNVMDMLVRIEQFLAKHLGGRALPPKEIPGSSAELR